MDLQELLNDKGIKSKVKTETINNWLLSEELSVDELIDFARSSKDPIKATCIESIQIATKSNPEIATLNCLDFISKTLTEKAPRVKWESAEVIGNIAYLYTDKLDEAIKNLLVNSEHEGTVVRWSAAFALGQILKIKKQRNKDLIPVIESICQREEKNSIKNIYLDALKKVKS